MSQRRFIHYVEGRGAALEKTLTAFLDSLGQQIGLVDACLLASPEQPGLWLVESRWAHALPELSVPQGCKSWSFEVQRLVAGRR